MKTKLHLKAVQGIAMLLFSINGLYAQKVTITSPTTETIWRSGDSCTISWTYDSLARVPATFNIMLIRRTSTGGIIAGDLGDGQGINIPVDKRYYTFVPNYKDPVEGKYYIVCLEDKNEVSYGCSQQFDIRKGVYNGMNDEHILPGLSIYPVPVVHDSKVTFTHLQKGTISLVIYDLLGKEVKRVEKPDADAGTQQLYFDKSFANGVYILQIQTAYATVSRKIIAGN